MKYSSNRNYIYPVLRPYADDYLQGVLTTTLVRPELNGDFVALTMQFDINEPSIDQAISDGNAICAAMLYCVPTMHREVLACDKGVRSFNRQVALHRLHGPVELHPYVIATNDISHPTNTAHPEYQQRPVAIGQWRPLAVDQPWHFRIDSAPRPTKSIFNYETDNSLENGYYGMKMSINDRFITITCNSETRRFLNAEDRVALSSVFVSALVSALAEIKDIEESDENINPDGWVQCIRYALKQNNISLADEETSGTSLFYAAQQLLEGPFKSLQASEDSSPEED